MPIIKSLVIIAAFMPVLAHAQQDVDTYFASVRTRQAGTRFTAPVKNENHHLRQLMVYSTDSSARVRAEAYYLLANLALTAQKEATAKEAVRYLLQGWRDADTGINNQVAQYLTSFTARYFDRIALDSIRSYMRKFPPYPGELFRLVSNLQLTEEMPALKTYSTQSKLPVHARWQAYTALARLGDQQAVDFMLNRVRSMGVSDDVVYELFPDLVYTRSFRAIRYLEEVLMSDDKRCDPPNGDSHTKITCAYRVMELLAPAIKDYPLTRSPSGDIAEKDYPKALDRVRAWFKEKDGTYEIIRDTF
jgi:hypothetical protein